MFHERSEKLERIDTGDYTPAEYDRFLHDIRLVNRYTGDVRSLKKSLLRAVKTENRRAFSVLDVGAGSGEFLRVIADFARRTDRNCRLYGLELNERSAASIREESVHYPEITSIRADAFCLPFKGGAFDYVVCSLFAHHFTNENLVPIFREFSRVASRKIFIIDLHRHRAAYLSYKIFCAAFGISRLVREDGSLSILRSFKPAELKNLAHQAGLKNASVARHLPFRLVLSADA